MRIAAAVAVQGGLHQAPREQAPPPRDQAPPPGPGTPLGAAPSPGADPPGPGIPPCGQNHRCLWKYNLAPTSLRAVIKGSCGPSSLFR